MAGAGAAQESLVSRSATAEKVHEWLCSYRGGKYAKIADSVKSYDIHAEQLYHLTEERLVVACNNELLGSLLYCDLHGKLPHRSSSAASALPAGSAAVIGGVTTQVWCYTRRDVVARPPTQGLPRRAARVSAAADASSLHPLVDAHLWCSW